MWKTVSAVWRLLDIGQSLVLIHSSPALTHPMMVFQSVNFG